MLILGIDPGLATTGWAIIDADTDLKAIDYGVISTKAGLRNSMRLGEIYEDLHNIIKKFKPELASVEILLFSNNVKTAMAVGEARGVCMLVLEQNGLPIHQYTPPQIKRAITGNGRADKRQVQENVKLLLNLETIPKPDDAADAIAAAVCCHYSAKMDRILGK
ncbi:MAG: Crossover junction endodeoxyribonuclease RuvC [candidate division WS6 bacterium GW2011_GWF2_39_15]|uniref:Crossover junction endodeoxyribonuclease RuvC n=1 Tax=candidate division WS6 bacterium GW2011_GWF2_39_15 TaxID=1619100 RepID=A0A0G0Q794_9BACT|nr:MAG: Crossover junction endodeoxyribonuclease RuvC [candidate division WS6 bacterium GW2011_GWF2_39_15]